MTRVSKTRPPPHHRSFGLTEEDARLWSRVTETARPLRKGRDRVAAGHDDRDDRERPVRHAAEVRPSARPRPSGEATAKPASSTAQLATIGRKERRRLAGGRVAVDARLDLHGLRQSEAHHALKAFLARARDRGHRHVLVVTGKGGAARDDETRPFYEPRDRGVLRRLVPQWLAEPEFHRLVSSVGAAHTRHGGEGALYVRLRRKVRN